MMGLITITKRDRLLKSSIDILTLRLMELKEAVADNDDVFIAYTGRHIAHIGEDINNLFKDNSDH